jgi:hypothetical protein
MSRSQGHSAADIRTQVGRIALRVEGDNWNAYYALPGTMEGALWIGSIAREFVVSNPERKRAFIEMMVDCVSDIIEQATGTRPALGAYDVIVGPEHERTGRPS